MATKEMVVKTMHDAAFDIAYDYIKPIYIGKYGNNIVHAFTFGT